MPGLPYHAFTVGRIAQEYVVLCFHVAGCAFTLSHHQLKKQIDVWGWMK
jgi:hypothetical protein